MKISKLVALAASMAWAIDAEWLQKILVIANREGEGPEAVAAQLGRPLDNTRKVTVRDGVAIVPVVGPIFRRASMLTDVSGATSIELLARDFRAALDSADVKAIVLDVDSPGGEVNGVHELGEMIYAARGRKPVVAYVGHQAASAAYWLATCADEIVCDRTAMVGSIGVVMALPAPDGAESAKQIEIVSSQSPMKRASPATKEGRAHYQARVDSLADVFVSIVARNRGTDSKTVLQKFGAGGQLLAASAVGVRMVDSIGSLEGTIARLAGAGPTARSIDPNALERALQAVEAELPEPGTAEFKRMAASYAVDTHGQPIALPRKETIMSKPVVTEDMHKIAYQLGLDPEELAADVEAHRASGAAVPVERARDPQFWDSPRDRAAVARSTPTPTPTPVDAAGLTAADRLVCEQLGLDPREYAADKAREARDAAGVR